MQKIWLAMVALGLSAVSAAAGCSDDKLVRFTELKDGDHLGGVKTIKVEVEEGERPFLISLYVDDQFEATSSVSPFELKLDTTIYAEGKHRVHVEASFEDSDDLQYDSVNVTFDNTPPVIRDLPAMLRADALVRMPVDDNFGIARVELESDLAPGTIVVSDSQNSVVWPPGCNLRVKLRAIDLAGNITERVVDTDSSDAKDLDCDGVRVAPAGLDCDDTRKWVYPGAPEIIEGFDFSCDGQVARRDGTDFDGDGVLSISDGGDDCDDADAQVHGLAMSYSRDLLRRNGSPLTWRSEEGLALEGRLYLNQGGAIERVSLGPLGGDSEFTVLATGANPGAFAASGFELAFGRGTEIVLLDPSTGQTLDSFDAGVTVGRLSYLQAFLDLTPPAVVYEGGGKVWLATRASPSEPWTKRELTTLSSPLIERPYIEAYGTAGFGIGLRTAEKNWVVRIYDGMISEQTYDPPVAEVTAARYDRSYLFVGRKTAAGGGLLQVWSGPIRVLNELSFPKPIIGIFRHRTHLIVQLEDNQAYLVGAGPFLHVAQTLPAMARVVTADDYVLAGDGVRATAIVLVVPGFGDESVKDYNCDGQRNGGRAR